MGLKLKTALLLLLMGAAAFTGAEALRSLQSVPGPDFPEEIYKKYSLYADKAAFVLRQDGDYVTVYPGKGGRGAPERTGIELRSLRRADRAMIEEGLPVRSRQELLELLEDLGS